MADNQESTRDRVRALVREVLATVPTEVDEPGGRKSAPVDRPPEHVVVNSLKDSLNKEWDRDESAKQLITEDDLRGIDSVPSKLVPGGVNDRPLTPVMCASNSHTIVFCRNIRTAVAPMLPPPATHCVFICSLRYSTVALPGGKDDA